MANGTRETREVSGLFDVRNIIGALLGIYGIVLLLTAAFDDADTTGGRNSGSANLWVGIVLLVVGILFIVWARLRPIEAPTEVIEDIKAEEHEQHEQPG
ncbi:MAG TPA: hypothetical protein VFK34_04025 [Marmoricola sp.]|jgi:hypothetical protein|nr:hypothetical protein [Marmoricola sp.]